VVRLDAYDAYYYSHNGMRPLPVLRIRYNDERKTWLYLDPQRGIIASRLERGSRWNRWLYHGFHSLDFPWLYYRRPLWDIVLIVLSIGGVAISVTSGRALGWDLAARERSSSRCLRSELSAPVAGDPGGYRALTSTGASYGARNQPNLTRSQPDWIFCPEISHIKVANRVPTMDRLLHTAGAAEVAVDGVRSPSSSFFMFTGVWLLALVGAAARGTATTTTLLAPVSTRTICRVTAAVSIGRSSSNLTVRDQDGQQATPVTSITINWRDGDRVTPWVLA
jgi:hypothetical protein